jgi:hypothetical protein
VTELEADPAAGSTNGTSTPSPSSGPRPPARSSTPSSHTAHELTTQNTRATSTLRAHCKVESSLFS